MGWFTGLIAKGLGKVFEGKTVGKFNLNDLIATSTLPCYEHSLLPWLYGNPFRQYRSYGT